MAKSFEDAIDEILHDLRELMVSKQKDYGPANILDAGEIGVVIRTNDKMARLKNLYGVSDRTYQKKTACNESIEDTWKDLANYSIIALMLSRNTFTLPLREKLEAVENWLEKNRADTAEEVVDEEIDGGISEAVE